MGGHCCDQPSSSWLCLPPGPCAVALAAVGPQTRVLFREQACHPPLLKETPFLPLPLSCLPLSWRPEGRECRIQVTASGFPSGLVLLCWPSSMILEDCASSPAPFWVVVITAGVKMSRMVLQASSPWALRRAAQAVGCPHNT